MANLKEQLAHKLSTLEAPAAEPTTTEMEAKIMAKDSDVIQLRPQTEPFPVLMDTAPSFVISLAEAKNRVELLQEFVSHFMKAGVDYGIVPGTDKPTLLKPGAEKLCEIYGLSKYVEIITQVEDWDAPLFAYILKVRLVNKRTSLTEAEGVGAANSREQKYIKQDTFTLQNTLLKMAKKRALVDAVLSATRSSGIFTQDIEDFDLPQQSPVPKPTAPVEALHLPIDLPATATAKATTDRPSTPTDSPSTVPAKPFSLPPSAMTLRQRTLIIALVGEHKLSAEDVDGLLLQQFGHTHGSNLTKAEGSQFIDLLLTK